MDDKKLVSKHIRMSQKIAKWYEDKAEDLGVSQTNLMVMALNEYIKQDDVVNMVDYLKVLEKEVQHAKKE